MDKLSEIRRPIEQELQAYRTMFEETLQTQNPLLDMALRHVASRQGKVMRPILVLLAAKLTGAVNEQVLHAAVAMELLHTASLVHDDVVDESNRRRGQKSLNALLDNKAAVLVGDFLLSKALYHSALTGSQQVVTWVAELGQTLSDGELHQLANLDKTVVSEEDYFEVISKKTAAMFETCARAGAFLSGGGVEDITQMGRFGLQVGLCFQLRDDLFDYDDQLDTGKPSGNDMREGKLTLPVIHALLQSGNAEMMNIALRVRRCEATDDEIARLVNFTRDEGGLRFAEQKMFSIGEGAVSLLDYKQDKDPVVAESLSQYVHFVVGRSL